MYVLSIILWSLAVLTLVLAIHPFITYPLSLMLLKKLQVKRYDPFTRQRSASGTFAICMCAYNEEQVIEAKMKNLLALREREPSLEILVYVDAASDRTAELLQPYANQIHLHVSAQRHGKTYGMNLLVAQAQANFIVFTDANVMLDLAVLEKLRQHFGDRDVGCVCGNLNYINADESVTAATGSLYWRLEEHIKSLEQETGSVMGADGSLFAIRRTLHYPPPPHIIDDMYVSFRVLCDGYRIVQAKDVKAYEKSATASHEEFQRKARIACQAFNVHRLLWPLLLQLNPLTLYKYVSHKLLRWMSIYFLVAAAVFIELALLSMQLPRVALTLLVMAGVAWWLGQRQVKPFAQIVDVLMSLAGAGMGVLKSLRGEQFQTWQPATSLRDTGLNREVIDQKV